MRTDIPELGRVLNLIDSVRRQRQLANVTAGILAFLTFGLGLAFLFVLIAMIFPLPVAVRWGMVFVWAAWALVSGVRLIFLRLIRNPTDEEIALVVENAYPELHNEIINAIRFAREDAGGSGLFVRAAIRESAREASDLEARGAVSWRLARRGALALAIVLAAWCVLLLGFRLHAMNALSRIVRPGANLPQIGSIRITEVIPGDVTVVAGENLVVEALLENVGDDAPPVRVQHFVKGGSLHEEKMQSTGGNRFRCELLDIRTPRGYRIAAGRSRSRDFKILVTDRPLVSKITVEYHYPAYTGLEPKRDEQCSGTLRALKGSSADLKIETSKPLKSALLDFGKDAQFPLRLYPGHTSADTMERIAIDRNRSGRIEILDEDGCGNARELRIIAERDQPPNVKIVVPGSDRTLAIGESLDLEVRGSDDFGVMRAELLAKRIDRTTGEAGKPAVIHEWTEFADRRNVACRWTWRFEEKSYQNGESVRYYVRMVDGNDVDGPGIGTSAEFEVRLEDAAARRKEREEKYRNWHLELEKLLKEQKELRREADGLDQK